MYLSEIPEEPFKDRSGLLVLDRNQKILRAFLNSEEQWQFITNDSVPSKLKQSIIMFEDEYFMSHIGFNPISFLKAMRDNIRHFKIKRGGSTITMQVARLLEQNERTFFNKFKEVCQAIRFELRYSKEEILSFYCNNAPYGKNIVGIQAASLFYFNKFPKQLSWAESALLAVLPNAPGLMHPAKNKSLLLHKRNALLKKLFRTETIDKQTYMLAINEPISKELYYPDKVALHFSERLKAKGYQGIVKTTIDKSLQLEAERLTADHAQMASRKGIRNVSVLVADTKSGDVLAYVGSQNYWDSANSGMVDGVLARRSSGSILKPFLYAFAIDKGDLIPKTFVKDIPSYYQGFSPNNADETFSGYVTAGDALIRSLNIPAVRVLFQYGVYPFYRNLQEMGVRSLFRTYDEYGLSLILGGAEVTLWDTVQLYTTLGRLGVFKKLKTHLYEPSEESVHISPMASWQILDVLKNLKRPGAEYYWDQYTSGKPVAWKTGTSYGQKDAWAVGTSPSLTIGVWSGNFTGEGSPNIAGAKSSGPLLFDLYNRLDKSRKQNWFARPEYNAKEITVCSVSGFRSTPNCNEETLLSAPSIAPLKPCNWHHKLYLSVDKKYSVCSYCWTDKKQESNVFIPPPDVALQLKKNGKFVYQKPTHKPTCERVVHNHMKIEYPENNSILAIPKDYHGEKMQILSSVSHEFKETTLYWYLNNRYLGLSTTNKFTFSCPPGKYQLKIIDAYGNEANHFFTVLKRN